MRPEIQKAVELLREKRPESLDQALALLQNTVFSFSMKVCGHREDAEDTMQETLLQAAPQLPNFDSPEALAVWLYKVAKTRCLMSRRRSKFAPKPHLSLDELLPDRAELEALTTAAERSPFHQLLRKENSEELRRAIDQIPPDYRMVLVLHDMEELSTREIARITGLREGTIRVRLHRARVYLRNQLARPSDGKPRARRAAPSRQCRKLFSVLSGYVDRDLEPAMRQVVEEHLRGCRPCEAFLASLEETIARCRRFCPEEKVRMGEELRASVMRACGLPRPASRSGK